MPSVLVQLHLLRLAFGSTWVSLLSIAVPLPMKLSGACHVKCTFTTVACRLVAILLCWVLSVCSETCNFGRCLLSVDLLEFTSIVDYKILCAFPFHMI